MRFSGALLLRTSEAVGSDKPGCAASSACGCFVTRVFQLHRLFGQASMGAHLRTVLCRLQRQGMHSKVQQHIVSLQNNAHVCSRSLFAVFVGSHSSMQCCVLECMAVTSIHAGREGGVP